MSLALLGLAGVLMDAHRREWRAAGVESGAPADRFTRRRRVRRTMATGLIAVAGALVALWPVVPREPAWVLAYTAGLAGVAVAVLGFALLDAAASSRHYRDESRQQLRAQLDELERIASRGDDDR